MQEIINGKLYDTEQSELIYSIELKINLPGERKEKTEKLYKGKKSGKYFLCVLEHNEDPGKFVSQQMKDNDGWELFEFSKDSAIKWAEKFMPTDKIMKNFDIKEM